MVSDMATDVRAKQASAERATDWALPLRLRAIREAEYPRFSDAEMAQRRAAIHQVIELEFSEKITDRGAPLRHFSIAETRVLGLQEGAQPRRQRQIRCPFR